MGEETDSRKKKKIIKQEIKGEHFGTDDYFFQRIGKPIPITNTNSNSDYEVFKLDEEGLPSQPLALSQHPHRLIFVAHSSGFCVARTKDVMDAAQGSNSPCSIQEVSLVDVPILHQGRVRILSLSADSSTLAASVSARIHFFSVASLLNKDPKPCFSCSLSQPSTIKDMQWRKSSDTSFLLLSNHAKLYHATLGGPLHLVFDNVDAFEWSLKGKYVAVARENNLSIFSSKFEEKFCISLPFKSRVCDSPDNCIVKVDSIRWVRQDSIIVGCFQQTADGVEENYLLQVVRSKNGKIIDANSELLVLSFYNLYSVIVDDIVPSGTGPYLLLAYLKQCQLAITAHRKNIDQHIVYLGWPVNNDMSEVSAVEIERDTWLPRIELQGNGGDNLVLGLCVDEVSLYEKVEVEVEVGVDEQKELSPYCVLMCVTLEGKLLMFYVASAGTDTPPVVGLIHDEEEDTAEEVLAGCEQHSLSPELAEQTLEQIGLVQSQAEKNKDCNIGEVRMRDLESSQTSGSTTRRISTERKFHVNNVAKTLEVESVVESKSPSTDGQLQFPLTKPYHDSSQHISVSGQQSGLGQSFFKPSLSAGPANMMKDPGPLETKKYSEHGSSHLSFPEKLPLVAFGQLNGKETQKSVDVTKQLAHEIGSLIPNGASAHLESGRKILFPQGSESRSLFSSSSSLQAHRSDNASSSISAANTPSDIDGKHFKFKDAAAAESTSVDFSVRLIQGAGPKLSSGDRKIESLPSIHSPQLLLPEAFALKDNYKASSMSSSEPNLYRQLGNIKEMTKELDTLLQGIEEAGGFRDACTVSQRISVKELEEGMGTLFQRCRMWKGMIDERLQDILNLLDETVQVLARKIYLDGIIKQAKDRRYWELWDQQRLSSEFEMKQRRILQLNQAMTNQLIELERHFNNLEFQKFGEQGGAYMGRRTIQNRHEPARSIEPLLSLHNTMNSQLAAAELLSDRLSKQMASLRIESPVNKNNVKKELFEMIGIPYDTSFSSPDATKVTGTTSHKKLSLSSGLATAKDHSRICQLSATKSSDSETARRRRDSLDQSWASFEPTKTTVKRVLLQDQNRSLNKSSLLLGRPHLGSLAMERSTAIHPGGQENSSTLFYPSKYEGVEHASCNQGFNEKLSQFESAKDPLLPLQGTVLRSPFFQSNNASVSTSYGSYLTNQNLTEETREITADKSSNFIQKSVQQSEIRLQQKSSSVQQSGLGSPFLQSSDTPFPTFHGSQSRGQSISEETCKVTVDKSSISIQKSVQQSGATPQQKSTIPTISPSQMPSVLSKSNEAQITDTRSAFTNSKNESVKPGTVHAKGSVFGSASRNSSLSSLSASPGAFSQPVKLPQFDIANTKSQPDDKLLSFPISSTSLSVSPSATNSSLPDIPSPLSAPSLAVPTLLAGLPHGKSLTASAPAADSSQTATSASFTVCPPLSPSNSLTIGTTVIPSPSNAPDLFTDSAKLEPQPATVSTLSSTSSTASHLLSDYHKTDLQPPVGQSSPSVHPALPLTTESLKTKLQSATLKSVSISPSPLTSELSKIEVQPSKGDRTSTTYNYAATAAPVSESPPLAFVSKLEPVSSSSPLVVPTELTCGSHPSLDSMATPAYNVALAPHPQATSAAQVLSEAILSAPVNTCGKNENLDVAIADEDEMEEEAPETTQTSELSLEGLRGFGAGSSSSPAVSRANPFGAPFGNIGSNQGSSSFTMSVPSGELFRPSSFSFSSAMPSQPSAPTNIGGFSSGFSGNVAQVPAQSAFGQQAHVGPGQQALGSVLGAFGQSRQLGGGLPGSGFASPIGFGGGFASTGSASGFSSSASGGGFAGVPTAGGFAGLSQAGRGFAGVAAGGSGCGAAASAGGFAAAAASGGGGFAGASSAAGGGFGAFSSQQGTGGFSGFGGISGGSQQGGFVAFGGNTTGTGIPPELFTQMRK